MANRTGTYVAFDGNGTNDPTKGDLKYYGLVQIWNKSNKFDLKFSDSHKKTHQVKDNSTISTLQSRLMERMRSSKNMLLIISDDTNYDRGMLNFEIEKVIDLYKLPIIVAYTGYDYILNPSLLNKKWPKALEERINNNTAKCIHIAFKEKAIAAAVSQFNIHEKEDQLTQPLHFYNESAYKGWGYKE
jgi:hypothetical protein